MAVVKQHRFIYCQENSYSCGRCDAKHALSHLSTLNQMRTRHGQRYRWLLRLSLMVGTMARDGYRRTYVATMSLLLLGGIGGSFANTFF